MCTCSHTVGALNTGLHTNLIYIPMNGTHFCCAQSDLVVILCCPGAVMFVMFDGLMLFSVSMLTCSQVAQVFQNITTNEVINQHRCARRGKRSRKRSERGVIWDCIGRA